MRTEQELLEEYLAQLEQGAALDEVLRATPDQEAELRSLLMLAATIRTLPHPALAPESTATAHKRLTAAFHQHVTAAPKPRRLWLWPTVFNWQQAGAVALACTATLLVGLFFTRDYWGSMIDRLRQGQPTTSVMPITTPTTTPMATPTVVSPIVEVVRFEPAEFAAAGCDEIFRISGTLHNNNTPLTDLELGYTVSQGAGYVSSVALEPAAWPHLGPDQLAYFALRVRMNETWLSADEGTQVRIQIFASRGDEGVLPATNYAVTIAHRCVAAYSPLAPPRSPVSARPVSTSTLPAADKTAEEMTERCAQPPIQHPMASMLANRYTAPYEEVIGWFCLGYGFGEIEMAYLLSEASGAAVADLFARRRAGLGWGQIRMELGIAEDVRPTEEQP